MDLRKVKILGHIKRIQQGYGPRGGPGAIGAMVQAVFDFVSEQPEDQAEGWVELFGILCATQPSLVTGGGWHMGLVRLAQEIADVPTARASDDAMTLEQIAAMTAERERKETDAGTTPHTDTHAAIIAAAGATLPDPTPSQIAVAEDAEGDAQRAAAHAAIIAQSSGVAGDGAGGDGGDGGGGEGGPTPPPQETTTTTAPVASAAQPTKPGGKGKGRKSKPKARGPSTADKARAAMSKS